MMVLLEILGLVLWRLFWRLYLWVPVCVLAGLVILRLGLKGKPYRFEIVIMKPGVNEHFEREGDSLEFELKYKDEKDEEQTINIKSDRLYKAKPSLREKIKFWFRGVKAKFWILYRTGSQDPISYSAAKVPARVLWIVRKSNALSKASESEFKVPMDTKKLIIILGAVIVGAVVWLVMTGQVKI